MVKHLLMAIGILSLFLLLIISGIVWLRTSKSETSVLNPLGFSQPEPTPKPLLQFTFNALSRREYTGSKIVFGSALNPEEESFSSHIFTYLSDGKKVTGWANLPLTPDSRSKPVIIMLRGYVDQQIYQTGIGTKRAAEVFAKNGYITLAPDFLGYGESDMPENDVWWERFHNPIEVLNLIASVKNLPSADPSRIGIWAHSNGGQIALSVLEISQKNYPTTLWAPVTKPFPYSVLYFTDEFDDEGKALRKEVARLEKDYDVNDYSITHYVDQIKAPIQLHQGTADDAVPVKWSDVFHQKLKEFDLDCTYYVYPGADHNMVGSWDTVVQRDVDFFAKWLK